MSLIERWRRWRRWRALRWRRWYGGETGGIRYLIDRLAADNRRRYWSSALKRDVAATRRPAIGAEVIQFPRRGA